MWLWCIFWHFISSTSVPWLKIFFRESDCYKYGNIVQCEDYLREGHIRSEMLMLKTFSFMLSLATIQVIYTSSRFLNKSVKPNYFSSSSFLLTWSRYTSPKWSWSLSRLVPCLKGIKLGCQVLLGHFGPVNLLQVSKNDDVECCF